MPKQNLPSLCAKIAYISSAFLLLASLFSSIVLAQETKEPPPASDSPAVAVKPPTSKPPKVQAQKLKAVVTVRDNIAIEAGLLTPESAKQLFGGWVADRFAVVQITIGNRSRDQQFVLQDIYFDYSDWALSGLYNCPNSDGCGSTTLPDYQSGTKPGQISSIGALEVHDSFKSASTFSRRNFVVNGLVLIGAAAGGFTALGPAVFGQSLTGFTSDAIPALQKFWPDRSIDQQSNLLKYGYQDKLVIAKEDPGKTYAFFPIARFLTSGLAKLYRDEPAIFFNLAELYLPATIENSNSKKSELRSLKKLIGDLIQQNTGKSLTDAEVMVDLLWPCGKTDSGDCEPLGVDQNRAKEIQAVKLLMAKASLNCTRIVVSGIMTVDVETIPATLTKITFDEESKGEALFSDSKDKATGVIEGKYLADGKPVITAISLPDGKKGTVDDYIVKDSLVTVAAGSTDSELHFSLQFTKTALPAGSKLTFQVVKSSSKSVNNDSTGANTTETTSSMTLDYPVSYTATASAAPKITKISGVDDTTTDVWGTTKTPVTVTVEGTDLDKATLKITKIVINKAEKTVDDYDPEGKTTPKDVSATAPTFTIQLKDAIAQGAAVTFEASVTDSKGKQSTATSVYTVPTVKANAPVAKPAPKPAAPAAAAGQKPKPTPKPAANQ